MTQTPITPTDSEGQKDRAAFAAGDAAARARSKDLPAADSTVGGNNADDKRRAAAMNTPVGAACDYDALAGLREAAPAIKRDFAYDERQTNPDGTTLASARLLPNSEQSAEYGRGDRYDAPLLDAAAREHAHRLQQSGGVDPRLDLGVSSTYRK